MQDIPATELAFVKSPGQIPTVEVDIDSLPEGTDFDETINRSLLAYASENPNLVATLYLYETQSVNFHEPTNSVFLGIAGSKKILSLIKSTFDRVSAAKVRYSDDIGINQGQPKFHLENGKVWQPADESTWFSSDQTSPDQSVKPLEAVLIERELGEIDSVIDWVNDELKGPDATSGLRFRQARSDASIGRIRKTIETIFGLPGGSVHLCGPDKKSLRADATISTLRKRWNR